MFLASLHALLALTPMFPFVPVCSHAPLAKIQSMLQESRDLRGYHVFPLTNPTYVSDSSVRQPT